MPEIPFDRLRTEVGDVVRQPDFATVRRRARGVRRRRALTSGAVFLATVLTAVGLGLVVTNGPGGGQTAAPVPVPRASAWPRMTFVATTGTEMYGVYERCAGCASELYASLDGGDTWQRRTEPPKPADAVDPRLVALTPLAPVALPGYPAEPRQTTQIAAKRVAERYLVNSELGPYLSDDGRTWRRVPLQ